MTDQTRLHTRTEPREWQCSCVGKLGSNAECGCCGGSGSCLSKRCAKVGAPKRCRHPRARVTAMEGNMATIRCDDCELTLYTPRVPYVSRHACRRVHKAPAWAQQLIDAYVTDENQLTLGKRK